MSLARTGPVWLLAALLLALPLRAQEEGDDGVPSQVTNGLMIQIPFLAEQMKRNFVFIRSVPFKDQSLAFRFCGHNDWDWTAAETKAKNAPDYLVPLGGLYTPNWEPDTASITVGYTLIQREVSLEDWVSVYTLKNGYRIHLSQQGTLYGKPMAEALVEKKEQDERWFSRLTVLRDGARLLVMECRCKLNAFPKHAGSFAVAATSLRFEEAAPILGSEAAESLILSSPFRLEITRPGSWKHVEETNDPLGCQIVHLINQRADGAVGGYVTLRAFDRERFPDLTVKAVAQEYVKQLGESGLKLKKLPIKGLPEPDPKVFDRERLAEGYVREDVGSPIEASMVVFSNAKLIVLVGMVTPGISGSEAMWLVNRQAFRMAIETIKVD